MIATSQVVSAMDIIEVSLFFNQPNATCSGWGKSS
jgi:hypothetical protein